jgi:hypothetical protein
MRWRRWCLDGCITNAPGGAAHAGRSPGDQGKQGRERSMLTDATGIPLHLVAAGANRPGSQLPRETLQAELRCSGVIPTTGQPAAGHVSDRCVVERSVA